MPSLFANIEVERVPGGHHCHLEGSEAAIAERIRRFLDALSSRELPRERGEAARVEAPLSGARQ